MARNTKTITISLPPEMAAQVEEITREEGRTTSELFREALRRYVADRQWRRTLAENEQRAKELGISPGDVERLIDEHRAEKR